MIALGLLDDDEGIEEFSQAGRHDERLADTRKNAEADAIRHAEDLLLQVFPIVGESEETAGLELAAMRTRFQDARGRLETAEATATSRLEAINRGLQDAEGALRSAGIPEGMIRRPPPPRWRFELRQIALAVAAALVIGVLVASLGNVPVLVAAAVIGGVALAIWGVLAPDHEAEPPDDRPDARGVVEGRVRSAQGIRRDGGDRRRDQTT